VDDTLVFSTPAFDAAFDAEGVEPYSEAFWKILNGSDEGRSRVKKKSREIFERHRAEGAEIYAITSRHPPGGEAFREYLRKTFGIPPDRVFFETGRKTDRIRELRLSVYYGDSDSDIEDAIDAGARGVRIRRSQKSSNIKATHPGKFGEEVVAGSED
jgi:acid phosphatase (class B)